MKIEYSSTANALYLRVRPGTVAQTVEIDELIYVDVDADGQPLGLEFVVADDFLPFLTRHTGTLDLPADLAALTTTAAGKER